MDNLAEAKELFLSGLALQESGELERAEAQYRKALALAPERPSIMNNLAAVLVQLNKCTDAKHLCERLLEINPRDLLALNNLGHCQLELNAPADALASYDAVLEIQTESADAHTSRGNALLRLARPHEALASYDRALAIAPGSANAHFSRGNALLEVERLEEAVTSYDLALAISPDLANAHYYRGVAMLKLGKLAEAVEGLSAAATRLPDDADVHTDLGVALTYENRHADAEASFRRAVTLATGDPATHLNLGNALAEQDKTYPALACYRKALGLDPGLAVAHFSIGKLYERGGRLGDAEAAYQAALEAVPDHAGALNNLGVIYHGQGRNADAVSCYRKVLAVEPGHLHALNNLGNILNRQGEHEDATCLYERALDFHPRDPAAYISLGELRARQGRHAEARALFEKALVLKPGDPSISVNLALMRLFHLEFEGAWAALERRLECPDVRKVLRGNIETVKRYECLTRWQGPPDSTEVGIWAEQGIGDQVLHSTLIPELIQAGVPFVYEVDRRLLSAYQRSFPGARFVPLAEPPVDTLQQAGRVLLSGSLPGLFRRSRSDFMRQPHRLLGARSDRMAHYRARFEAMGPGPKVAVSWRSKNAEIAPLKSVDLIQLAPLLTIPGVHYVNVQYGDTTDERRHVEQATGARLLHFEEIDYFNDLEELLAILEACDLVITTSNATAHFAGALGKRVWLLYPGDHTPFFYWAHGGGYRSLWYPSVEIVTAPHLETWDSLIEHAAARLVGELR